MAAAALVAWHFVIIKYFTINALHHLYKVILELEEVAFNHPQ
jgi:hypothetical protein